MVHCGHDLLLLAAASGLPARLLPNACLVANQFAILKVALTLLARGGIHEAWVAVVLPLGALVTELNWFEKGARVRLGLTSQAL